MKLRSLVPRQRVECPKNHTEYPSRMVADNAKTLHQMRNPLCWDIRVFMCGDHFHIGHSSEEGKEECMATSVPIRRA